MAEERPVDIWQDYAQAFEENRSRPSPLRALAANTEAIRGLEAGRLMAIIEAVESGADWDQVGDALGMSRGSAWSLFCRMGNELAPGSDLQRRYRTLRDPLTGGR